MIAKAKLFSEVMAARGARALAAGDAGTGRWYLSVAKTSARAAELASRKKKKQRRKEGAKRRRKLTAMARKDPKVLEILEAMGMIETEQKRAPEPELLAGLGSRIAKASRVSLAQGIDTASVAVPALAERVLRAHEERVRKACAVDVEKKSRIEADVESRVRKGLPVELTVSSEEYDRYRAALGLATG